MRIRPALAQDAPQMVAVLTPIILAGGTTALQTPLSPEALQDWFVDGPKTLTCHVAELSDRVVGFQWLGRNPKLPEDCADIATFAQQSPKVPGVGRALFAQTTTAARALGLAQINATIRADNVPGLSYYRKMGFVDHGVTKGVPLKDGTPVDRVHKRFAL